MGQIEKFWCLSYREFPEFFKNGPTFYSSSTQWPSVTIFHKSLFFLGHPVDKDRYLESTLSKLHLTNFCQTQTNLKLNKTDTLDYKLC